MPVPVSQTPYRKPRLQATVAAFLALGLWLWLRGPFATAVVIIAAAIAGLAWLAPQTHAPVQRALERVGRWIALGVSWCLLAIAYLGLFVPLRAWRALTGRDPLGLRADVRVESFLRPLPPPRRNRFERMY